MIKEYYEQFYANKLDNTDKMNNFLESYKLLKPRTDDLNRSIICKDIKLLIKKTSHTQKSLGLGDFIGEF